MKIEQFFSLLKLSLVILNCNCNELIRQKLEMKRGNQKRLDDIRGKEMRWMFGMSNRADFSFKNY